MRTKNGNIELESNVISLSTKIKAMKNDSIRKNLKNTLITPGIQSLPDYLFAKVLLQVASFDGFTEDNDPYGERDFGRLLIENITVFWKIDYFSDEDIRRMTIMLADEY